MRPSHVTRNWQRWLEHPVGPDDEMIRVGPDIGSIEKGSVLVVGGEIMWVDAIPIGNVLHVQRGVGGSAKVEHAFMTQTQVIGFASRDRL